MKSIFLSLLLFIIIPFINGCALHKPHPIEPPGPIPETFVEEAPSAINA